MASVRGRASFAPDQAARLEEIADTTFLARDDSMTTSEALFAFRNADVVAVTPKVAPPVDAVLLEGLPRLRGLSLHATGYDFIDVEQLQRYRVVLSVLPEYSTESVAEHTIGLVLTMSRRIHLGNDRSRALVGPDASLRGFELAGRTLGIIGCGRIGSRVAGLAQAFGMDVLAYDIAPKPVPGVTYVDRDVLLGRSDVLTLHCPMEFGASPMIGPAQLARMRPGCVLINASRAGLVDDGAVVAAIRGRRLRGYAVDDAVFAGEAVADLLREGRIVQTGHSGWWSDEVLERGSRMWGEHIHALVVGEPVDVVADTLVPGEAARHQPA